MSELVTVAINAATSSPVDFLMGPMILPITLVLTFTVGIVAWKVATVIENKLK